VIYITARMRTRGTMRDRAGNRPWRSKQENGMTASNMTEAGLESCELDLEDIEIVTGARINQDDPVVQAVHSAFASYMLNTTPLTAFYHGPC
jgi:hypothetical protein